MGPKGALFATAAAASATVVVAWKMTQRRLGLEKNSFPNKFMWVCYVSSLGGFFEWVHKVPSSVLALLGRRLESLVSTKLTSAIMSKKTRMCNGIALKLHLLCAVSILWNILYDSVWKNSPDLLSIFIFLPQLSRQTERTKEEERNTIFFHRNSSSSKTRAKLRIQPAKQVFSKVA